MSLDWFWFNFATLNSASKYVWEPVYNVSIQMLEISNFWSKLYPFIKNEGSFHEVCSMTREAGFKSMGSPRNLL